MIKKKNKLYIRTCNMCGFEFLNVKYIKHRVEGFCDLKCLKAWKNKLIRRDRFAKYFKKGGQYVKEKE